MSTACCHDVNSQWNPLLSADATQRFPLLDMPGACRACPHPPLGACVLLPYARGLYVLAGILLGFVMASTRPAL